MRRIVILALATLMVVALAAPAVAAPRQKGTTTIDATNVLPLFGGVVGNASADGADITFGVTGNYSDGTVEHVGGIVLNTAVSGDAVELKNFTIDLNRGFVSGIVNDSIRIDLFSIEAGTVMALSPAAAAALQVPGLAGVPIIPASVDLQTPGNK
jgi:hypothetical protein